MKTLRSVLAAAAMLMLVVPAQAAVECRQTAVYDASTNGSTVLVPLVAAKRTFICGYTLVWGGTATVKLVSGTGSTCGTNEVALTPAYSGVAQTVVSDSSQAWRGLTAQRSLDLCIKTSAGVAVQAIIYYSQQ